MLAVTVMAVALVPVSQSAAAQEVSIAVFGGAEPVVFTDENGNAAGIIPELLGRILRDIGYEARFVPGLSFADAYRRVVAGEIDLLPGAAYSPAREAVLDFSHEAFVVAWGQLGVLPNRDFNSVLDLRDRRIGMVRDGQNGANFIELMHAFDVPFQAVYFDSFADIRDAVLADNVAAGVFFNTWFRSDSSVVPSSIIFSPTQGRVATATGRNAELLNAIDTRLAELKADQDSYYYDILSRWLSQQEGGRLPRWVRTTALVVLLVLVVLGAFVLILRREVARATEELRESNSRFETVANYAFGWEFWLGADGSFVYVSPNTERVTGFPAEAFVRDPALMERMILPEDADRWIAHRREAADSRDDERSPITFRIRRADGETRWIEHHSTRITASDGTYLGERGSNVDITELVVQQQHLERSVAEKEAMLREIHHRVKNNLQTISSLISLQKHTVRDGSATRQLDAIAGRVSAMNLLHSAMYQEESFGIVKMQEYLEMIGSRHRQDIGDGARIDTIVLANDIELDLSRALPCGLVVNEALSNAWRHARGDHSDPRVTIALTELDNGWCRLSVTDSGAGPLDVDEIWARRSATVGIQLIESLALQLGGSAWLEAGGGLAVVVEFPR